MVSIVIVFFSYIVKMSCIRARDIKRLAMHGTDSVPEAWESLKLLINMGISLTQLTELCFILNCSIDYKDENNLEGHLRYKQLQEQCLFSSAALLCIFAPYDFDVDMYAIHMCVDRAKVKWMECQVQNDKKRKRYILIDIRRPPL